VGSATDLYNLAAEWLATCVDAVTSTPGGAIPYAFVSPGNPPLDCELLAVWAGGPIEAETAPLNPPLTTGNRDTVQGAVHLVNLTCCVVRCSPVGDDRGRPPSAAAYDAAAQQTMADVWAIWNFSRTRHRDGILFPSTHRREFWLEPAYSIAISGGLAGWQVPIRVQLDGYRP
jgi:hypothetical protein